MPAKKVREGFGTKNAEAKFDKKKGKEQNWGDAFNQFSKYEKVYTKKYKAQKAASKRSYSQAAK